MSLLLAHGVGRIYELPVPLPYYLAGSAVAVAGSFLAVTMLGQRPHRKRPPFRLAGAGATARLAKLVRLLTWTGFLLALVSGVVGGTLGFSFSSVWLWVGMVVGLVLLNSAVGGLWRLSDPWIALGAPMATLRVDSRPGSSRKLERYAGPVLLYSLFWFELVSDQGFSPEVLTPVLAAYTGYAIWIRARFPNWQQMDPFILLYEFASRSSLLAAGSKGIHLRIAGAEPGDRLPMPAPVHTCLFVLLGATSFDNLRETPGWQAAREVLGLDFLPAMLYDSLALAVLGLPFFVTFRLALAASGDYHPEPRTAAWSLAPIAVAYLLAHNVSLLMVTLPVWFVTISDPLGLGWNLFGLAGVLPGFRPSPALVWFLEVGLVVGGHVIGVVMAHRIASGATGAKVPIKSQVPMTLLMTLYTVATLWLLSLTVVSG
ncbi:MAG: hypothetical protein ACT4OM_09105 [Actinomycetota bacterium]